MEAITPRLRPFFLDFTTSPVATSGGGDGAPTEDTASMRTADGALKPKPPSGKTKSTDSFVYRGQIQLRLPMGEWSLRVVVDKVRPSTHSMHVHNTGFVSVGLLITARQVLAAVTQRLTVVIIDFREAKPNHIQSESDHLRLIFIDPRRISHM